MLFFSKLKNRGMYAIKGGDYIGGFYIYIKEEDTPNNNALLIIPSPMKATYITRKEIKMLLKYKDIEFVERLPTPVYDVCRANFIYYAKEEGIYVNR